MPKLAPPCPLRANWLLLQTQSWSRDSAGSRLWGRVCLATLVLPAPPWVLTWWGITHNDSLNVGATGWPSRALTALLTVPLALSFMVPQGHPSLPVNLIALLAPNFAIYFQM